MAYLNTTSLDRKAAAPIVWEALTAHLDKAALEPLRPATSQATEAQHLHHVQQMLLAASMTAGAILAVAAVVLLRML